MSTSSRVAAGTRRVDEAERTNILDRLAARERQGTAKNIRGSTRVTFYRNDIAVQLFHPGGSCTSSQVITRDLSAGGISFIYPGFLHKGTKIEIVLGRRLGGDDILAGVVQHCALIHRTHHLIGVRFVNKIFPKIYLDPSLWDSLDDSAAASDAEITGRVVHVDDQQMDRMLLKHFLKGTGIDLASFPTIKEAVAAVAEQKFDCVLSDLVVEGVPCSSLISQIRQANFNGPVGILTAETSPQRLIEAHSAGANAVLAKPYDVVKLIGLLSSWLSPAPAVEQRPITSTLWHQTHMHELIEQYVQRTKTLAGDLKAQIELGEIEPVRKICQLFKGSASGFGYAGVAALAREAVEDLDTCQSLTSCLTQLKKLQAAVIAMTTTTEKAA